MDNAEICALIRELIDVGKWGGIGPGSNIEYSEGTNSFKVGNYSWCPIVELIHDIEVLKAWYKDVLPAKVCPLCGGSAIYAGVTCPICPPRDRCPEIFMIEIWLYEFRKFCGLPIPEQIEYLNKNQRTNVKK